MTGHRERDLSVAGIAACAGALAVAHGAELFLGLNPCAFCLLERWPYNIGLGLGILALLLPKHPARLVLWALTLVILSAAALSLVHTGVEAHWWPDPLPECRAPDFTGMTLAQRLAAMPARPAKPCEDPDYLLPGIPLSMTQMGLIYALAVSSCLAIWLTRSKGRRFR
jgi:disulfide bond formation protein DsbB